MKKKRLKNRGRKGRCNIDSKKSVDHRKSVSIIFLVKKIKLSSFLIIFCQNIAYLDFQLILIIILSF